MLFYNAEHRCRRRRRGQRIRDFAAAGLPVEELTRFLEALEK